MIQNPEQTQFHKHLQSCDTFQKTRCRRRTRTRATYLPVAAPHSEMFPQIPCWQGWRTGFLALQGASLQRCNLHKYMYTRTLYYILLLCTSLQTTYCCSLHTRHSQRHGGGALFAIAAKVSHRKHLKRDRVLSKWTSNVTPLQNPYQIHQRFSSLDTCR